MSSENIPTTIAPVQDKHRCQECGAELRDPTATRCWLCKAPLEGNLRTADTERNRKFGQLLFHTLIPGRDSPIMWIVAVSLVLAPIARLLSEGANGVVFILVVVMVPALVRTVVLRKRRQVAGAPATASGVLLTFLSSIVVVVVVGVACFIAFLASCFAICLGFASMNKIGDSNLLLFSLGLGLIGGLFLYLTILLTRYFWPRKG